MNIATFEPESLIELDDLQGFRKLAFVAGSGDAYVDLIDDDAPTWPLYLALHPVTIGNSLSWGLMILDQRPIDAGAFNALHRRLLAAGLDSLTFNRALYWAYQEHIYGYAEALQAGRAATDQVHQSRQSLDCLAKRGRSAHLRLVV
jgi:hypothetical protein